MLKAFGRKGGSVQRLPSGRYEIEFPNKEKISVSWNAVKDVLNPELRSAAEGRVVLYSVSGLVTITARNNSVVITEDDLESLIR